MISLIVQILAYSEQLDSFVRQEALDLPQIPQEVLHFGHLEYIQVNKCVNSTSKPVKIQTLHKKN